MTREHKLALIVGFSLVLVVGILISDHLSPASLDEPLETLSFSLPLADPEPFVVPSPRSREPAREQPALPISEQTEQTPAQDPIILLPVDPPEPAMNSPTGPVEIVQGGSRMPDQPATRNGARSPVPGFVPVEPERTNRVTPTNTPSTHAKYVVQEGDTVAGIARRFLGSDTRWPEIQALNPDRVSKEGGVRAGVTLKVPISSTAGSGLLNTQERRSDSVRPVTPDSGSKRNYVVKANDTLSQIAQKELGTSKRMDEILKLNKDKIENPDEIYEGLKLVLPAS